MVMNATEVGIETPCAALGSERAGQRSILQLVLGGYAGTVASVLILSFLEPGLMGRNSDPARALGAVLGTSHDLGLIVFLFFNGSIIFPMAFAFFTAGSRAPWLAMGLIWGMILWLLAGVVVMPIAGFGFFGYAADGLRIVASSLAGHLAYGGLQGLIAIIPPRRTAW
jgi:cation transporter-like permease